MPKENWTVLLVRGEDTAVRQFEVSPQRVKVATVLAALAALVLVSLTVVNGVGAVAKAQAAQLTQENELLEAELAQITEQVTVLDQRLGLLADRHTATRLVAGLAPIDPEVLEVGVGGPGGTTLTDHPLWSVDSMASKDAFAASYDLRALERRTRLLDESLTEATDSLNAHQDLLESVPSILPAPGSVLSSRFSRARLHPIHNRVLPHEGIDLSAPEGTPINAAAKGVVTWASYMPGLGQAVRIDHGYGYQTRYGHASKLLVRVGQRVDRGDVIALVGKTGLATAPHVHYEVRVAGKAVNPMNFVLKAIP
jgi:murein DD-endopeptidase MepM/ murein hydrolase activator NlpD